MLRKLSAPMLACSAALLVACLASPANAALYVFDVTVTSATVCTLSGCGNVAGFQTFTYRQTWDISPAGGSAFSLNGLTNNYMASGQGAITPGQLNASLLGLLGLTANPGEIQAQRTLAQDYDGDPVNDD